MAWYRQLHWQILIGLGIGLAIAITLRSMFLVPMATDGTAAEIVAHAQAHALSVAQLDGWRAPFQFVGDLFLRLLKLIVLPLIVVSVISGIQAIGDPDQLGRVGWRTIAYYVGTTLSAVVIGLVVVNVVQPGVGLDLVVAGEAALRPTPILDVFRNIIPTNFFAALAAGDMLPTIFVSILFAAALTGLPLASPIGNFVLDGGRCAGLPSTVVDGGHGTTDPGVTPSRSMPSAVTTLKVEPGAYRPSSAVE